MKIHFEKDLPVVDDFKDIFLNGTPMLDVRAPVEFLQGAFPTVQNIPLMNDEERHQIGLRYKQKGQDEAIRLGADLIDDTARQQRVEAWQAFIEKHPNGLLYCFRGGMRSKISQQWIYEQTGKKYPRVQGGYKALRRFLIDTSERLIKETAFTLLSGSTGSGKTRLLAHIPQSIDLEGLAHHRGSAFGGNAAPQPTQINFENSLAIRQLKLEPKNYPTILLEDEGRNIGSIHLPKALYEKMTLSPIILLNVSAEERLQTSMQEYAIDMLNDFETYYGQEQGFVHFSQALLGSLDRIKKRLGGERHKKLRKLAEAALATHQKTDNTEAHIPWVSALLTEYYDPMYNYQLDQKRDRIIFTGDRQEVLEYIRSL